MTLRSSILIAQRRQRRGLRDEAPAILIGEESITVAEMVRGEGRRSLPLKRPEGEAAWLLAVAVALDLAFGEPAAQLHPVVWIGKGVDLLERRAPAAERRSGFVYGAVATLALTGAAAGLASLVERAFRLLPRPLRVAALAALLKPAFSLRMLLASGCAVRRSLEAGDLDSARSNLRSLVSRETATLSAEECAAAAVESLAENLADSVVAPWLAYALFGLPGAWLFRAANTLDSRWGYHGRYERLGRVPARLDDLLAYLPARLSALCLIAAAPAGGGSPRLAWQVLRRDHALTESPNAGWTMSAMAGALGLRLGKRGHYALNAAAAACTAADIRRTERIVLAAAAIAVPCATGLYRVRRRICNDKER